MSVGTAPVKEGTWERLDAMTQELVQTIDHSGIHIQLEMGNAIKVAPDAVRELKNRVEAVVRESPLPLPTYQLGALRRQNAIVQELFKYASIFSADYYELVSNFDSSNMPLLVSADEVRERYQTEAGEIAKRVDALRGALYGEQEFGGLAAAFRELPSS